MQTRESRGPILMPVALVAIGVILLLNNFLFLGDFDAPALAPLLLVAAGAVVLLRGDLTAGGKPRTFSITRGSVESVTLEISAGEVDVEVRRLHRDGRLIAGQFAPQSRPELRTEGTHAHLIMRRARTPWLSFADWQTALATDLPWQIHVSTNLGQVNLDLSGLIVQDVVAGTGFGDIHFVCPDEALERVSLRSAFGAIHVVTPPGQAARIHVKTGRLFTARVDSNRYQRVEPGVYEALDASPDSPVVEITVRGTFGDAYLA
ncbi:MAG TPA: hypothetical protein PKX07_04705 [Aggregatilineales bacterium]|nr:hypothetical protein [Aggregatilineales bacterium]